MAYEDIEVREPITGPASFREGGERAYLAQAAIILSLAALLLPTEPHERESAIADNEVFPLPHLEEIPRRLPREQINQRAIELYGQPISGPGFIAAEAVIPIMSNVAAQLYERPEPLLAGILAMVALNHPDPLIAAAGATATYDIVDLHQFALQRLIQLARLGTPEPPDLPAQLARAALERISSTPLQHFAAPPPTAELKDETNILVLVHGTTNFLSPVGGGIGMDWWRPNEPLHDYLRHGSRPDIYSGPNYFRWGGAYSDQGRDDGAWMLRYWLDTEKIGRPDIVTHSHGGNVVFQATHNYGVTVDRLVVLSCPVHWNTYSPRAGSYRRIASIRIHKDLIIMADRGGQSFPIGSGIPDHHLPFWFRGHGDPCLPSVWQNEGLDPYIT